MTDIDREREIKKGRWKGQKMIERGGGRGGMEMVV